MSLAVFRKEISRFILLQAADEFIETDAGPTGYSISPINSDDKVTIDGIESGLQYSFDFLPGPGAASACWRTTRTRRTRVHPARHFRQRRSPSRACPSTLQRVVYYENERFSARASYNWRDQWLITASGRGSLPEFNREYGQLDASLGFNFNENVSLFLEGINLTDEEIVQENAPARPIQFETFGKRVFFGVRGKF